jgi:tripartite-type tricarboxylate transporter receptor subunit TctC
LRIGEDLGAFYRQNIMIDNRTGAGGLIGNMLVSKANADGYTLGMVDVTRIITELMRDQPPYRALADVVGVAHVASITNVLAVARSIPARSAPEFVGYARAVGTVVAVVVRGRCRCSCTARSARLPRSTASS